MANLKSSQKNIRRSRKRRQKNLGVLSKIKEALRKGACLTPSTQKLIDKAAKERIISPARAARIKSRAAKKPGRR